MSNDRLIRLNSLGKLEVVNLQTATPSGDGLMSELDKERLDYLVQNAAEKLRVGKIDDSIQEEIVNKLKFGEQFIINLDTFNEAQISLPNFIQTISNGLDNFEINSTRTLTISGGDGIDVTLDEPTNSILINSINSVGDFSYQSSIPSVLHEIDHNLNSTLIHSSIYVEDPINAGQWSKDICKVQIINSNRAEVWLTESSNIIALFSRKAII